jgi:hypothetical protein
MAERPIFVPAPDSTELVKEIFFPLKWHPGFAPVQKEKNIAALHEAAAAGGFSPLLEISTKSGKQRGQHLSAFYMKVKSDRLGEIPLECAFQGSKVFERGGPFTDLYTMDVRDAKRDSRLKKSGALIGFQFDDVSFPLEPKTVFYDWLYITFLYPWREWGQKLYAYAGFTDIEFNPYRSINCQARSCALFLTLMKRDLLDEAVKSPSDFIRLLSSFDYRPQLRAEEAPLFTRRG